MDKELFRKKYEKASEIFTPVFEQQLWESTQQLGEKNRLVVCMEEAAEFIQVVSKYYRDMPDRLNLIEEIGDVILSIEALKQLYDITDSEIRKAINVKMDRGISVSFE